MEEMNSKDQQQQPTPLPGNSGRQKLQRYLLRSGTKSKEEKPPAPEMMNSAPSTKRGRPLSSVSKSVGVLEFSAKDKSAAKPPRRLSIPTKSNVNPAPKFAGNITPISEARARRAAASSKSPVSDVSRSATNRKRFNILSSASYWLSQIKLSENAAKHSISIGFFKLALEAGCEPLQRMRDELKSYACRHNLNEQGEPIKELFESYNISENSEQLQVSEPISQVPEEGTRSSDDEVHSSSSTTGSRKLKSKSLMTNAPQASPVTESAMKGTNQRNNSAARIKGSWNKNSAVKSPAPETGDQKWIKKPQKPNKVESNKENDNIKKQGKKSAGGKGLITPSSEEGTLQSNKENMDVPQVEEISTTEVM